MLNAKIIFSAVVLVGLTAVGGSLYIDHKITTTVDEKLQAAVDSGQYQALTYGELNYNLNGEVTMLDLEITQDNITYIIEEIHVTQFDINHAFPHELSFSIKGLRLPDGLPATPMSTSTALNDYLGTGNTDKSIPLEIEYSHTYLPDQEQQFDPVFKLKLDDYLDLNVNSTIRNLDIDALVALNNAASDPADAFRVQSELNGLLEKAAIKNMRLTLADSGAVQAYMEMGAEQMFVSPDELRDILTSQVRSLHLFLPPQASELVMAYGEQLAVFLEGNRTLSLSIEPQMEGSIQRLQPQLMGAVLTGDFQFIVDILDLQLVTE